MDRSQMVAEIIDSVSRSWRLDEIADIVSKADEIAISMLQSPYRFIWPAAKNGIYSVKSGFMWVHRTSPMRRPGHPSSSHNIENVVWHGIWSV